MALQEQLCGFRQDAEEFKSTATVGATFDKECPACGIYGGRIIIEMTANGPQTIVYRTFCDRRNAEIKLIVRGQEKRL